MVKEAAAMSRSVSSLLLLATLLFFSDLAAQTPPEEGPCTQPMPTPKWVITEIKCSKFQDRICKFKCFLEEYNLLDGEGYPKKNVDWEVTFEGVPLGKFRRVFQDTLDTCFKETEVHPEQKENCDGYHLLAMCSVFRMYQECPMNSLPIH